MLPDGSVNPRQMTSFNHYALGSVINWLHERVGGISPKSGRAGWKIIEVRPMPGGNAASTEVSHESPYGLVKCSWTLKEGTKFEMELLVPPNASAQVYLPDGKALAAGSGSHKMSCEFQAEEWPSVELTTQFIELDKPEIAERTNRFHLV